MYFYGLFLAPKLQENFWVLYRFFYCLFLTEKDCKYTRKRENSSFFLQNKVCREWALLQLIVSYIKYDEFS